MENLPTNFLNEENYKDLFDNANDLIQIVDLEGKVIYANKSWMNHLEYTLDEIQGQSIYSFINEDDRSDFFDYRNKIINGSLDDKEIVVRFNTKSGKIISLEGIISLRRKDANPFYTRGLFRNITARLANEAQLKEREYNLHQLLLNAPDAVIVIDKESKIIFWNPQAENIFGWTASEVANQPLSNKIIPEQHREAHDKGMKRYLATGEAHVLNQSIEITAINKAGDEFYVSLTISTTSQHGELSFIAFLRDIRKQKKNELELQKKTKELELSNQQLEQYAHVASHDMKEPIRKIRMFSNMLEHELGNDLTQQARKYFSIINIAAKRLNDMVEGVLNYATTNSIEAAFEKVDLNDIIKNICNDFELLIEERHAVITCNDLSAFPGVPFLIHQLFYNLIYNSLKFSKENLPPLIEITAKEINRSSLQEQRMPATAISFLEIKIKDNGIGFNQEHAIKIFKTFTRLNSRSKYDGTGLGLSLCKNIMERHHGYIKAEGEEGIGATFIMLFPLELSDQG